MKKTGFTYGSSSISYDLEILVPEKIELKKVLLEYFGEKLKFPDYDGVKWDAFEECLRDLSWIKEILLSSILIYL